MTQFSNAFMQGMSLGNRAFDADRQHELYQQRFEQQQMAAMAKQQFALQQQMAKEMQLQRSRDTATAYLEEMAAGFPQGSVMRMQAEQAMAEIHAGGEPAKVLSGTNFGDTAKWQLEQNYKRNRDRIEDSQWRMGHEQDAEFHADRMQPKSPRMTLQQAGDAAYQAVVAPAEHEYSMIDGDYESARRTLESINKIWLKSEDPATTPDDLARSVEGAKADPGLAAMLAMLGGGGVDAAKVAQLKQQAEKNFQSLQAQRQQARGAMDQAKKDYFASWPQISARAQSGAPIDPQSPYYAYAVGINPDAYEAPDMQQPQQQLPQPAQQPQAQSPQQPDPGAQMAVESLSSLAMQDPTSDLKAEIDTVALQFMNEGDYRSIENQAVHQVARSGVDPGTLDGQRMMNEIITKMVAQYIQGE